MKHVEFTKKEAENLKNLILEATLLSNVAYNYKQDTKLPSEVRALLEIRQKSFDAALEVCSRPILRIKRFIK